MEEAWRYYVHGQLMSKARTIERFKRVLFLQFLLWNQQKEGGFIQVILVKTHSFVYSYNKKPS